MLIYMRPKSKHLFPVLVRCSFLISCRTIREITNRAGLRLEDRTVLSLAGAKQFLLPIRVELGTYPVVLIEPQRRFGITPIIQS